MLEFMRGQARRELFSRLSYFVDKLSVLEDSGFDFVRVNSCHDLWNSSRVPSVEVPSVSQQLSRRNISAAIDLTPMPC